MAHKKLTDEQWNEIKTRYNLGEGARAISRDYGIPHGTIQIRAKKGGWTTEIANEVAGIKESLNSISQMANLEQHHLIENYLKDMINHNLEVARTLLAIDKGGLNLHGVLLKRTIDKVRANQITEKEASVIMSNLGLGIDKIAGRAGIKDGTNSTVNVNTQVNHKDEQPISITFSGK